MIIIPNTLFMQKSTVNEKIYQLLYKNQNYILCSITYGII